MKKTIIASIFFAVTMFLFLPVQGAPSVQASGQVAMADDDGDELEAREEMKKEREDELKEEKRGEERERMPLIETSMMEECKC